MQFIIFINKGFSLDRAYVDLSLDSIDTECTALGDLVSCLCNNQSKSSLFVSVC